MTLGRSEYAELGEEPEPSGNQLASFGEWAANRYRRLMAEADRCTSGTMGDTAFLNRALGVRDAMDELGMGHLVAEDPT